MAKDRGLYIIILSLTGMARETDRQTETERDWCGQGERFIYILSLFGVEREIGVAKERGSYIFCHCLVW